MMGTLECNHVITVRVKYEIVRVRVKIDWPEMAIALGGVTDHITDTVTGFLSLLCPFYF